MGYAIGNFPNKGLRWEKTRTFEVGLDLGFIRNRINANFTVYDRLTSDKIQSMTLPHSSGHRLSILTMGLSETEG